MPPACALLLLAAGLGAPPYDHDPGVAEELRARGGLPNFVAKLKAGASVKVAYLGGSITAANGWRPKTLAWLREQYPRATITEINAAISGTGSDYSACRVRGDVLVQQPDLVFLECRVNGGGGFERQSVEGVVRQIWAAAPRCDLCFVYTIGAWMVKELEAGRQPGFGRVMEMVANAYGIPTIDLGVEVARRIKDGTLAFNKVADQPEKPFFANDAGHNLYRDVIARSLLALQAVGAPGDHALPTPLAPDRWQIATLLPIEKVTRSTGWTPVDTATDKVYRDDFGRTHAMLRGAVKCAQVGETLTVKWTGTTVGLSDIPYGEPVVIEAVVDGGKPIQLRRTQTELIRKFARFCYLPAQPAGEHTVVFTVKSLPAGQAYYAGHVLVVGVPAGP
jgi:hypothetical protein